MIDIHSHILFDVDDGPKNIEEAILLLEQAKNEGVTDIIVTPHHLHPNWSVQYSLVEQRLEELKIHPKIETLGIRLYPGQEIRIKDQLFDDLGNMNAIGLNNSKYVLIELPSSHVPSATKRILFELQTRGYIPIIAHPERNKAIANDLKLLYELVNSGALAQLTSTSLNGDLGRKIQRISLEMIDFNLVHFVASDAHNVKTRPFLMKSLFDNKKLINYKEDISLMLKNAQAILNDYKVNKRRPEEPAKAKRFFGLF